MPSRVLETVLTGRNLLSPVLTKAAADVEGFDGKVTAANARAGESASSSAKVQETAAAKVTAANARTAESSSAASAKVVSANVRASESTRAFADVTESSAARAGIAWGSLATKALPIAALAAAVVTGKMAGDFQQLVTKLETTAGETKKNIGMVSQGMLDMAGQVGVGADELAKAMYIVESSGQHGAQALDTLKASAEGAKQENADLGKVADAVSTIMHDYGKGAGDAADVTSRLVTAVSTGKTNFDELTGSLHSVTPLAAALHVPLADILGDLAAMTASGESADQATQNMADALRHLQAPTSTMTSELAQLGITSSDLATDLSSKGLSGTIQEIESAIVKHLDPATQKVLLPALNQSKTAVQDLQTMMGKMPPSLAKLSQGLLDGTTNQKDFRKAALDLGGPMGVMGDNFLSLYKQSQGFNNVLKAGGPQAQVFSAALQKAMGTSAGLTVALQLTGEHAAVVNDNIAKIAGSSKQADGNIRGWSEVQGNFNQKLAEAGAEAKSLAIEAGQHMLPVLTGIVGWIGSTGLPAIEHLGSGIGTVAHWFGQLPGPIKDVAGALALMAVANKVGIFSALASGASSFLGVIGKVASGTAGAVTSLSGLKAAGSGLMNFFGGPMVLGVTAAIATVTAAVVASSHQLDDWAKGLEQGGQAAFDATQQMDAAHTRSIASAHSLSDAWGIVKGAFSDGLAQIEGYSSAQDKATQQAKDWYDALSPTQKLTQNVTVDQNNLNDAVDAYGRGSEEAKFAAWHLSLALGDQQSHQAEVDAATRGTNGALQAQIGLQQQLSQAGLSLDQAQLSAKQSIDQYKSSLKDANLTEDDRKQALDNVQQSIFGVMDAAKQKADAETKGLPQQLITNQEIVRQRDALDQVVQQLGFVPPALQGMYDQLNGPTAKALQAAQTNVNNVGSAMTTVTTNDIPGMQKALGDLATAAGTTFPLAVTGGFLPAAKGAGDVSVITGGQFGQAKSAVDGVVQSLLSVPAGTDVSNRAMGGLSQWTGGATTVIGNLSSAISHIPGVQITADATQANNTIDAFLQKVQSQGFVGAIWNIHPIGGGGSGGVPGLPPIPGRAGGGIIPGARSSVRDNVLGLSGSGVPTARVEPGEFVVNAAQTSRNRLLLEGINSGLVGLAGGGYVLPRSLTYPVDAGQGLMTRIQQEAQAGLSALIPRTVGGSLSSIAAMAIGQAMAAARGWTGAQWSALAALWNRESGWNANAVNPSSGAYGIPQSLGHGHPYNLGDVPAQVSWGDNYIAGRYGNPVNAWAHETKFGWYDRGGPLQPGYTLAYNGTGKTEWVNTAEQQAGPPASMPGYSMATAAPTGPLQVTVALTGARITGRLELGADGFVHLIDGRVDNALGALHDDIHYATGH